MDKQYKCAICHDTGSFNDDGLLDCVAFECTAAQDRTELNDYMASLGGLYQYTLPDLAWMIHQRAVAMCEAKVQALPEPADVLKRRMDDK